MASVFKDKVVIVTGSSSGIGEAIAIMFASRGAKVILSGRAPERLKSVLNNAVKVSGGYQDRFLSVQGDINDQRVRKEIVAKTVEMFGGLDILVANAGIIEPNQSVFVATQDTYDRIMDTNLKSVFFLIQEAVPHLHKSKGNIVNISSVCTSMALADATLYSLSKVAVDHLTRCLAVDLGPKGIRVNGINPGYIPTLVMRNYSKEVDKINNQIMDIEFGEQPLKTRKLTAEDVAEAVAFLASDAAGVITGVQIKVDGGRALVRPIDWSILKE